MSLGAADFPTFYEELHGGQTPFPWQVDLTEQVLGGGQWPELIDVPTGLGKTALLDIAVFVAAATSRLSNSQRAGRRRIFFVVDRRIVVDEAFERAREISAALDEAVGSPVDSVLHRVALELRAFSPNADKPLTIAAPVDVPRDHQPVLAVTKMRGGVTWDAAWLPRPDLPGIVVGTVDQVGSRLLFRGYGVSDRRKPIDAALVGADSLILVDEAHLAAVMVSTLDAARRRDRSELDLPPATVIQMTATPTKHIGHPYRLDVDAHRGDELAWRRLNAPKRLQLLSTTGKEIVATMARTASDHIRDGIDTVLVVCNTVDRARLVHAALAKERARRADPLGAEVDLLIGRSRLADREPLVERLTDRFGVGRRRETNTRPAILVATQTVEVGVNFDADALVTESAPWDALVQRLGRMNRLGEYPGIAQATVVHDGAESLIYGDSRQHAWAFLQDLAGEASGGIDVSPLKCRDITEMAPENVLTAPPTAPIVLQPMLDAWTRTAPIPVPDAPVAPYLHGADADQASVSIAWRDGLIEQDDVFDDDVELDAHSSLMALPVLTAETVEVPLHAARCWLLGERVAPLGDIDDVPSDISTSRAVREPFRALAWRNGAGPLGSVTGAPADGSWTWIEGSAIRPGDILVVPTERGGLDGYGWEPTSMAPVLDVSEVVRFAHKESWASRGRLRLDPKTADRFGVEGERREQLTAFRSALRSNSDEADEDPEVAVVRWFEHAVAQMIEEADDRPAKERLPGIAWTPATLTRLQAWLGPSIAVQAIGDTDNFARSGTGVVFGGARGTNTAYVLVADRHAGTPDPDDESPECSSMGLHPVPLRVHHVNVGDRARDIAKALGLQEEVVRAVELAARWHDLGKVEPRFQAMLCGGDEFEALLLDEPLAKSGMDPTDRAAYRRARKRSELPAGARHEAWSAEFAKAYLADVRGEVAVDPELVVHLIASHHGHARPWLPPVHDEQPTELATLVVGAPAVGGDAKVTIRTENTVDFSHPGRFAHLNETYGRWGLALLESIVRCADMTVSGEGS